ncbi:MAG: tRNA (adenosine(37)-N6)-threonylcarbamoyltransferase complex ATPase subunit type 1 TsaE [Parcubacteria group bacterium]
MVDSTHLWLPDAKTTRLDGASLVDTLYRFPVTILLTGSLGSGKTTFLQGFGEALGITQKLTSPTYALEQRYKTQHHGELLHIDLYRLTPKEALHLVSASEQHRGIRCIEWADRLPPDGRDDGDISVALEEGPNGEGRMLQVSFDDIALPSLDQVSAWREEFHLPHLIGRHCDQVAQTAVRLAEAYQQRGCIVRLGALRAAGWVHDLLRFVDFHRGAGHIAGESNPLHERTWAEVKAQYPGLRHEAAAAQFLTGQGYPELGEIVRVHGLTLIRSASQGASEGQALAGSRRVTIEQKLLYYADKRVKIDEVVSLEERLRDFTERYSRNGYLAESDAWYQEARKTERDLFPTGVPF